MCLRDAAIARTLAEEHVERTLASGRTGIADASSDRVWTAEDWLEWAEKATDYIPRKTFVVKASGWVITFEAPVGDTNWRGIVDLDFEAISTEDGTLGVAHTSISLNV